MLSCGYPEPSEAAEAVVVSTYAGEALSTVAIDDPQKVTTVAVLEIAAGNTPIYVVAGSTNHVIFELRGAVERIEQIVTGPLNGVVGIDSEKVYFVPEGHSGCVPRSSKRAGPNSTFVRNLATVLIKKSVRSGHNTKWASLACHAGGSSWISPCSRRQLLRCASIARFRSKGRKADIARQPTKRRLFQAQ